MPVPGGGTDDAKVLLVTVLRRFGDSTCTLTMFIIYRHTQTHNGPAAASSPVRPQRCRGGVVVTAPPPRTAASWSGGGDGGGGVGRGGDLSRNSPRKMPALMRRTANRMAKEWCLKRGLSGPTSTVRCGKGGFDGRGEYS